MGFLTALANILGYIRHVSALFILLKALLPFAKRSGRILLATTQAIRPLKSAFRRQNCLFFRLNRLGFRLNDLAFWLN